jgi:hypothetical protein
MMKQDSDPALSSRKAPATKDAHETPPGAGDVVSKLAQERCRRLAEVPVRHLGEK